MSNTFMSSPSKCHVKMVSEGHPDKICDQVSDAVLDTVVTTVRSRVACETAVKTGYVMLLGEITTNAVFNYDELVRKVVNEIRLQLQREGLRRFLLRRAGCDRQAVRRHRHGRR